LATKAAVGELKVEAGVEIDVGIEPKLEDVLKRDGPVDVVRHTVTVFVTT